MLFSYYCLGCGTAPGASNILCADYLNPVSLAKVFD